MNKVVMYSTPGCPYCIRARELLRSRHVAFEEINVENNPELRATMKQLSGGRNTVPQIFINNKAIGGSDDLHALEHSGELDKLLQ